MKKQTTFSGLNGAGPSSTIKKASTNTSSKIRSMSKPSTVAKAAPSTAARSKSKPVAGSSISSDGDSAEATGHRGRTQSEMEEEDQEDEDQEEEDDEEENESQDSQQSDQDDPEKKRFMRKEPQPSDYNPDGTLKYQTKSKLLLKINQLAELPPDVDEEDNIENSFGEELTEEEDSSEEDEEEEESEEQKKSDAKDDLTANGKPVVTQGVKQNKEDEDDEDDEKESGAEEDEEGDDDEYGEEEDSPKKPIEKKKSVTLKQDTHRILAVTKEAQAIAEEKPKKKKIRRIIVNVYCTEYDVVPKCARKIFNARLRYKEEDHEGAVNDQGEGGQKLSPDWDLSWHDLSISADFLTKMSTYQKVNQYPGIYVISRKHNLARNLNKMQRSFPEEYDFFPRTWILPHEQSDFRKQFYDADGKPLKKKKTFIVKPDGLSQGQGIYLSRNCEQIIQQCTVDGGHIVQQYLDKPHLVDELKYDLRIYVLVYGLNPLRVYIHEQGIARFATESYVPPRASNMENLYMHLTNYAINKHNTAFKQNQGGGGQESEFEEDESDEEESGHKRSLHSIMKILMQQGADPDLVMDTIKDIIVKTVIVGQPYMSHIYRSCQPDDYENSMCFQILGFDIMIDKYFRPWLIEVNQSPSFATDSALDYEVKKNVILDAFKLLNLSQERREEMIKEKQKQMEERIFTGKQEKLDAAKKQEIKDEKLSKRFQFENSQIRCGMGNNYELLFPSLFDEEKNQKYEMLLKKANDIWDEFTCGAKGKKKALELEEQSKKAELAAKKLQVQKEKKFQNRAQKKGQGSAQRQMDEGEMDTLKIKDVEATSSKVLNKITVQSLSQHTMAHPEQPTNASSFTNNSHSKVSDSVVQTGPGSMMRVNQQQHPKQSFPNMKQETRQQQFTDFIKNQNQLQAVSQMQSQENLQKKVVQQSIKDAYQQSNGSQKSTIHKQTLNSNHKQNQSGIFSPDEDSIQQAILKPKQSIHNAQQLNQPTDSQYQKTSLPGAQFQVNKQVNQKNKMAQIHENANMLRQQQQHLQLQSKQQQMTSDQASWAQIVQNRNEKVDGASSGLRKGQAVAPVQNNLLSILQQNNMEQLQQTVSGAQLHHRRMLQQHNRQARGKNSGYLAIEKLENDIFMMNNGLNGDKNQNPFSNTKYGHNFSMQMHYPHPSGSFNEQDGLKNKIQTSPLKTFNNTTFNRGDRNLGTDHQKQTQTAMAQGPLAKNSSLHLKAGQSKITLANQQNQSFGYIQKNKPLPEGVESINMAAFQINEDSQIQRLTQRNNQGLSAASDQNNFTKSNGSKGASSSLIFSQAVSNNDSQLTQNVNAAGQNIITSPGNPTAANYDLAHYFHETPKPLPGSRLNASEKKAMFSAQSYTNKMSGGMGAQPNIFSMMDMNQPKQPLMNHQGTSPALFFNGTYNGPVKQCPGQGNMDPTPTPFVDMINAKKVQMPANHTQFSGHQWTPQTKLNGSNKFPGLAARGGAGCTLSNPLDSSTNISATLHTSSATTAKKSSSIVQQKTHMATHIGYGQPYQPQKQQYILQSKKNPQFLSSQHTQQLFPNPAHHNHASNVAYTFLKSNGSPSVNLWPQQNMMGQQFTKHQPPVPPPQSQNNSMLQNPVQTVGGSNSKSVGAVQRNPKQQNIFATLGGMPTKQQQPNRQVLHGAGPGVPAEDPHGTGLGSSNFNFAQQMMPKMAVGQDQQGGGTTVGKMQMMTGFGQQNQLSKQRMQK